MGWASHEAGLPAAETSLAAPGWAVNALLSNVARRALGSRGERPSVLGPMGLNQVANPREHFRDHPQQANARAEWRWSRDARSSRSVRRHRHY
jgi:hypothetical protein